jgi:hypothetical protein
VRTGSSPVVIWRLGDDPGDSSASAVKDIAADVASDMIPITACSGLTTAFGF